jgi:hypothetical protein
MHVVGSFDWIEAAVVSTDDYLFPHRFGLSRNFPLLLPTEPNYIPSRRGWRTYSRAGSVVADALGGAIPTKVLIDC